MSSVLDDGLPDCGEEMCLFACFAGIELANETPKLLRPQVMWQSAQE
jgi:hypothetical protein